MDSPAGEGINNPLDVLGLGVGATAQQVADAVIAHRDLEWACRCLVKLGDPLGVEALLLLSNHLNARYRQYAAFYLGLIEAPGAVRRLVELLGDEEPRVRNNAQAALIDIGSPLVAETLVSRLDSCDRVAMIAGVEVLGVLAETQTRRAVRRYGLDVGPVLRALGEAVRGPDVEVRREAARALAKAGELAAEVTPELAEAVADEDCLVRARAVAALGALRTTEAVLLLEEVALPLLQQDLEDPDTRIQVEAAHAARHIGAKVVPTLVAALPEASETTRFALALTLRHLEQAGAPVVKIVEPLLESPEKMGRRNVVRTLEEIGTPEALELVRTSQHDMTPESPEERLLRMMETWAKRTTTTRAFGYRLSFGELVRVDRAPLVSNTEVALQRYVEKAIGQLGDRLAEYETWDVSLESDEALAGLVLRPRAPRIGINGDERGSGILELVFDRKTEDLVLVIGASK